MKYFVLLVTLSFLAGLLFWRTSPRLRSALLFGLCLALTFAFFFLNKI